MARTVGDASLSGTPLARGTAKPDTHRIIIPPIGGYSPREHRTMSSSTGCHRSWITHEDSCRSQYSRTTTEYGTRRFAVILHLPRWNTIRMASANDLTEDKQVLRSVGEGGLMLHHEPQQNTIMKPLANSHPLPLRSRWSADAVSCSEVLGRRGSVECK